MVRKNRDLDDSLELPASHGPSDPGILETPRRPTASGTGLFYNSEPSPPCWPSDVQGYPPFAASKGCGAEHHTSHTIPQLSPRGRRFFSRGHAIPTSLSTWPLAATIEPRMIINYTRAPTADTLMYTFVRA